MNKRPEFRINLWRTSMKPAFYAYQIYRDRDHALLAGGECRTKISAQREAQARIRQMQARAAALAFLNRLPQRGDPHV